MRRCRSSRIIFFACLVVAQCLAAAFWPGVPLARAQRLSIRHYDVSDGLAHSHVAAMHQDAKGYLWLATWEGLSRFDGYRFTNYGPRDGLGDPIINDIAEDREGRLWVATNGGGVARLIDDPHETSAQVNPAPTERKKFLSFRVAESQASNIVNALIFDSLNNLWCATDGGLYRAAIGEGSELRFEAISSYQAEAGIAFADHQGRLWFGSGNHLIEVLQDQIIKYGPEDGVGRYRIDKITEDRQGRLLVANEREVFEFVPPAEAKEYGRWRKWPLTFKPDQGLDTILSDSAGTLWIGTWNGLAKYKDGKQTIYTSAQGLSDNGILSLVEDRDGNLWIGTDGGGVCKLSSELIVSFTKTEGLPNQNVRKVIEDTRGNIFASIANGGLVKIVDEKALPLLESQVLPFSNFNERIIQDNRGDWWIGTDAGLFRFQGPELQLLRGQRFTAATGIAETTIIAGLYQEPSGKIWISQTGPQGLCYFVPGRNGGFDCVHIPPADQAPFSTGPLRMISDPAGALWVGGHWLLGKIVNERVVALQPTEGLPESNPRAFFLDSRGWLWIGLRFKGVSMTKDPTADNPKFVNYSTAEGLASDAVWTIAEDDFGRIYLGTGKGLDQLDLATGRIRHFNTEDGLASDVINYCHKDREGNIWVATTLGLSKFNPRAERRIDSPTPIYLSRIQVAGEELALPETGASRVPELEVPASRNNLLIEYVALSLEGEGKLRYQYKLEGVDENWSAPTDSRSINYARLAAGSYQFLVRAINQEGIVSSEPAAFRFRVLRPIWQRWWFLALAAVFLGLAAYAFHRQRVARLVELERVRTRIATDLHDDIGANLSLIAMLSEVARGHLQRDDPRMKEWFSTIASTSRDTVDAMSDLVWAVNPKRDHLSDLTHRMRRFADDISVAGGIELRFRAPAPGRDVRVGADLRREVFLIFKESVNNMVRHSGCTEAEVELQIERAWLSLSLSDNGRGFNLTRESEGNGLASMRVRAARLGGTLEVSSRYEDENHGTRVTLRVPIDSGRS